MAHGYAVGSALTGLSASSFTFTNWSTVSNREFLNDGAMDRACFTSVAVSSTRYILIDLGTAKSLVGIALLNHNLATWAAPAVTVEAADNSGMSVNLVTAKASTSLASLLVAPVDKETVLQFPAVSRRYWRLTLSGSGTEAIRIGEILALTSVTTLLRLAAYGRQSSEFYAVNRVESSSGNVRSTYLAGPVRSLRLPFIDLQGATQRDQLMAMWRATYGGASNLLWIETIESINTAATSAGVECVFGKLQPSLAWRETDYTIFDVDALELRGLGRDVGR